jgi:hypothetical protein
MRAHEEGKDMEEMWEDMRARVWFTTPRTVPGPTGSLPGVIATNIGSGLDFGVLSLFQKHKGEHNVATVVGEVMVVWGWVGVQVSRPSPSGKVLLLGMGTVIP